MIIIMFYVFSFKNIIVFYKYKYFLRICIIFKFVLFVLFVNYFKVFEFIYFLYEIIDYMYKLFFNFDDNIYS